jgi:hypothetical protein
MSMLPRRIRARSRRRAAGTDRVTVRGRSKLRTDLHVQERGSRGVYPDTDVILRGPQPPTRATGHPVPVTSAGAPATADEGSAVLIDKDVSMNKKPTSTLLLGPAINLLRECLDELDVIVAATEAKFPGDP